MGSEDAEAVRFDSGGCEIIIEGTSYVIQRYALGYYVVYFLRVFPSRCGLQIAVENRAFGGKREKVS